MQVIEVCKAADRRKFVHLPEKLFATDPCYVPPIWLYEKNGYTARGNPILANADFVLLLAVDNSGQPLARTIAYIDHKYNQFYRSRTGFLGAFECINNSETASLLIKYAENWLLARGMTQVLGPINPVAENWGFVYEGFASSPVYMSPWNPPYYNDFFQDLDYVKAKDLYVYDADMKKGYDLPERYKKFEEKILKKYPGLRLRRLDLANIKRDARIIWEISNIALADNWGYVPLDLPVMEDMLKKLKLIVDPDAVWIAEHEGEAVAFCLGFPDINIILKQINGHLLPWGWLRLLHKSKKLEDYRLFGLAVYPEWQNRGLDALMYVNLFRHLADKNIRMEANYILEDNFRIKNAIEKLGMRRIKIYRIYEKKLAAERMDR